MPRYAAFLRSINVGGRRVTNAELAAVAERAGFTEVSTFRASGNLVLATRRRSPARIATVLERALGEGLGYDVPVLLRSAEDIQAIAGHAPFPPNRLAASGGKLQVLLLAAEPAAAARREVLSLATDEDRLALAGRELYWLPRGGISDSDLDLARIERLLGTGTMRTMGTIEALESRFFADDRR